MGRAAGGRAMEKTPMLPSRSRGGGGGGRGRGGCYDQRRGRCLLMFMSRTSADGYLRDRYLRREGGLESQSRKKKTQHDASPL